MPPIIPSRNNSWLEFILFNVVAAFSQTIKVEGTYIRLKIPVNTTPRYIMPAILAIFTVDFMIQFVLLLMNGVVL